VIARLGGVAVPAVGVQFQALGRHAGKDGEAWTEDDLDLGPVAATWRMDDYAGTRMDDDPRFVGRLSESGLFTPATEEPDLERPRRSDTGDVWVVARYRPEGARHALRARVLLQVAVPDYRRDL
jgi:quinohemoprotein amine dehydrogenase